MWMKKGLGQNLLVDRNYQGKIIAAMDIDPADAIIEIGPGLGAMTRHFLPACLRWVGIELDQRFCEELREEFGSNPKSELIHADFLEIDLNKLINGLKKRLPGIKRVLVFGNIPYKITSPILLKLCKELEWDAAFLTMQREVAERIMAQPGSKICGAITLRLKYQLALKKLFKIPAGAFSPKPKVDSTFVYITALPAPAVSVPDEKLLFHIIRTAFGKRRKMLSNSLKYLKLEGVSDQKLFETMAGCGINLKLRPEQLTLEDFAELTRVFHRAFKG